MRLSVVVVNWNSRDDTAACLESLAEQTHEDLEVLVVDNGSKDDSVAMIRERFPWCTVLPQGENLGFAEGCNRGIEAASGEWVALLNNDAVADPEWAAALVAAVEEVPPACGMLQSLMLLMNEPGLVNSTGIELARSGGGRDRGWRAPRPAPGGALEEIFCPTGGAAAYRRTMLDALKLDTGYLDREHFCYYEDMDLGWRARLAGWSAFFVPASIVHHRWHGSTSRRGNAWLVKMTHTNRIRTLLKNASLRFILRTGPDTTVDLAKLFWYGRADAAKGLVRAVRSGLAQRPMVTRLAKEKRRRVERAWVR